MAKEGQAFTDILTIFGDKSQASDNLANLKDSIGSALMQGLITGDDIENILGRTKFNIGADLGGGYELGVGVNTPSPMEDMIDDYRIKLTKRFQGGGRIKTILEEFKDKSQDADNVKATILDIVRLVDESKQLKDDRDWDFSSFLTSPFAPEEGDIEINEDVENLKDLILAPKSYEEGGEVEGIDWDFISSPDIEGESKHLTGYVPTASSGFTVGSVDVGQHSPEDLRYMLQSYANKLAGGVGEIRGDILEKISPYALKEGITDEEAKQVEFDEEDIKYLTEAKRASFEKTISKKKGWKKLDPKTQTVLGSIAWQYGSDSPQFKKMYKMRDDISSISDELIAMGGEEYEYRRKKESEYLGNK